MLLPNVPHPGGRLLGVCILCLHSTKMSVCSAWDSKVREKGLCDPNCVHMEWPSLCVRYDRVWSRPLLGECLGVWCEWARGYSQTDVSVRREKQKNLWFGKPNIDTELFHVGSSVDKLSLKPKHYHTSFAGCFLPVAWLPLHLCRGYSCFCSTQSLFHPFWYFSI